MAKVAKVPVIMQMEAVECGAACLGMILAYYGKWILLEQLRIDCGVSRDGSNAKNILRAAKSYGLKVQGYRTEPSALREIVLPAIIHWEFNHFVVLNGFKKNRVVLNDPAKGTVEVTFEEFDRAFTGIVLCFETTEEFVPDGKPRSVWKFAKQRLRGTSTAFAFVLLTGIITSCIGIAVPIYSRIFVDYILSGKNPEWMDSLILVMLITLFVQFIVNMIQATYWLKIQGKLAIEANASFMWHVLRLPVEFFSQRYVGDIVSRQISNESIAATLINQFAPILINLVFILIYFIIMLHYSIVLSVVGLVTVVINMLMMRLISTKRVNMSRVMQRDTGKLEAVTMSGFEMIETIKASGAEHGFFQRWAGYFTKQSNAKIAFNHSNEFYNTLPSLLQQLADISVLTIGGYLILDGSFTIGMLLAFQGFLSSFLSPVNELMGVGQALMEMRSSIERIEDIYNYKPDVFFEQEQEIPSKELNKLSGDLELRNITFGYSKLSPPLIKDFSLKVKKGGSVALVEGSGSGKSTIAKLISGLYQPWSGEILFDKLNRNQIDRNVFTRRNLILQNKT